MFCCLYDTESMDFHVEVGLHPKLCDLIYAANRALRVIRRAERAHSRQPGLAEAYQTVIDSFDVEDGWLPRRGIESRMHWTPYSVPTLFLDTVRIELRQPRAACAYVEFRSRHPGELPVHLDGGASQYSDFSWAFATLLNWELLADDPDGPHASQLRFKTAYGVKSLRASLGCSWDDAALLALNARQFGDRTAAQVLNDLPSPDNPPTLTRRAGIPIEIQQAWAFMSPEMGRNRLWISGTPPA